MPFNAAQVVSESAFFFLLMSSLYSPLCWTPYVVTREEGMSGWFRTHLSLTPVPSTPYVPVSERLDFVPRDRKCPIFRERTGIGLSECKMERPLRSSPSLWWVSWRRWDSVHLLAYWKPKLFWETNLLSMCWRVLCIVSWSSWHVNSLIAPCLMSGPFSPLRCVMKPLLSTSMYCTSVSLWSNWRGASETKRKKKNVIKLEN